MMSATVTHKCSHARSAWSCSILALALYQVSSLKKRRNNLSKLAEALRCLTSDLDVCLFGVTRVPVVHASMRTCGGMDMLTAAYTAFER